MIDLFYEEYVASLTKDNKDKFKAHKLKLCWILFVVLGITTVGAIIAGILKNRTWMNVCLCAYVIVAVVIECVIKSYEKERRTHLYTDDCK